MRGVAKTELTVSVVAPTKQRLCAVDDACVAGLNPTSAIDFTIEGGHSILFALNIAVPIHPIRAVGNGVCKDVIRAMVCHGVDRIVVKRRILVVDAAIGQEDDVVLAG